MRGLKRSPWLFGLGVLLAVLVVYGGHARAEVTSDQSASIIIFPKVIVDASHDTYIQIANTDNMSATVECFYIQSGTCSLTPLQTCNSDDDCEGNICTDSSCKLQSSSECGIDSDCDANVCIPPPGGGTCFAKNFSIFLTGQQPTIWLVSEGRSGDSVDGFFSGNVLPVASPFVGALKCVEVDGSEPPQPLAQNSLKGEAIITGSTNGDLSEYNAIGIKANGAPVGGLPLTLPLILQGQCLGGNKANSSCSVAVDCPNGTCTPLVCGGTTTTAGAPCLTVANCSGTAPTCAAPVGYNACPAALYMNHSAERGPLDSFTGAQASTELSLVPCSDLLETSLTPVPAKAQLRITSDMEESFSCSFSADCVLNVPLSVLELPVDQGGKGCTFSAAAFGSATLKTRIRPADGNVCYTGDARGQTCASDDDCPCTGGCSPSVTPRCRPYPGLLGVAEEFQTPLRGNTPLQGSAGSAAVNLHMEGSRAGDIIVFDLPQ